jgi:histidinol-phosphatase (PHP family)
MIDYHVHCDYSVDAGGAIDEYVTSAVDRGVRRICFTTHCDLEPGRRHHDGRVRVGGKIIDVTSDWLESYKGDVEEATARVSADDVEVRCGLEIGFVPGIEKMIEDFVAPFDFDFILGGIHTLRGIDIVSTRESSEYFKGRTPRQVCEDYYSYVEEAAAFGLFDSIAHLDIYKKCGLDFYGGDLNSAHRDLLEPALEKIAAAGLALEVNSAGLRKGRSHPYPSPDILKGAREAGITGITLGSDCHSPEEIASDIDRCIGLAREAGYSEVVAFAARKPFVIPFEELSS